MIFAKPSRCPDYRAIALTLLLSVLSATVSAVEGLLPPQQVIQETSNRLQANLQKPEYRNDFKKATGFVDRALESNVDFERVSALILGKYWKSATPSQRDRFKKEFRLLLVRTYTTAFTEYANWQIRYLPLDMNPTDTKALVRTEILQSGAPPAAVNYRMILTGSDWKVIDVLIEGISLLQNYRSSFTEEVGRTGSLDDLIKHLADRNASAMKEPLSGKGEGS
jgi:phospholipid transport system substrate-binding protein